MAEQTTTTEKNEQPASDASQAATPTVQTHSAGAGLPARSSGARRGGFRGGGRGGYGRGRGRGRRDEREEREFDQKVVDLARVTRVMAGGKRMRFRACVVIGDHKGRVGMGLAKGADVTMAITKAVRKAEKSLIHVPMVNETIPHAIEYSYGAAHLIMKPASKGRGIIAGGPIRLVLELSGVKNVACKMRGSNNKINNVRVTLAALHALRTRDHYQSLKA